MFALQQFQLRDVSFSVEGRLSGLLNESVPTLSRDAGIVLIKDGPDFMHYFLPT